MKDLYQFWFSNFNLTKEYFEERKEIWFKKNPEVDEHIIKAYKNTLDFFSVKTIDYKNTKTSLNTILLLDQIPRHIYRGSYKAHIYDADALHISLHLISKKIDLEFNLAERLFAYMPLQHTELLSIQNLSVKKYESLLLEANEETKPFFLICFEMAKLHQEVIERFGRFPHRNSYMGRVSSPQEIELLKNPKYHF